MTLRTLIRIPGSWMKPALYTLQAMSEICGLPIQMPGSESGTCTGALQYSLPSDQTKPEAIRAGFIVKMPFLASGEWPLPRPPPFADWKVRAYTWVSDGTTFYVRSPRWHLEKGEVLAQWDEDGMPAVVQSQTAQGTSIEFGMDPVASFFSLATQVDEELVDERDSHGRVPEHKTFPIASGVGGCPTASDSALALGRAVQEACTAADEFLLIKSPWPDEWRCVAAITHDIDSIRKWIPRRIIGLVRGALEDRGIRPLKANIADVPNLIRRFGPVGDPHRNLRALGSLESTLQIHATYFVQMSAGRMHKEPLALYGYRDRYLRGQVNRLAGEGHEIALHASYESADRPETIATEAYRLSVLGMPLGIRQHYLRIRPDMWRTYEGLDFAYDSSIGYSGFPGFRSGLCHPYHPYSGDERDSFSLLELPFAAMDSAIYAAAGGDTHQVKNVLERLGQAISCRRGLFISVWHNHYLDGTLVAPGSVLEWLVTYLKRSGWHFATLGEVANWWEAREAVKLFRIETDKWEVVCQRPIAECPIQVVGRGEIEVANLPRDAWAISGEPPNRTVVFHRLVPSITVIVRRAAGTA